MAMNHYEIDLTCVQVVPFSRLVVAAAMIGDQAMHYVDNESIVDVQLKTELSQEFDTCS